MLERRVWYSRSPWSLDTDTVVRHLLLFFFSKEKNEWDGVSETVERGEEVGMLYRWVW